MEIHATLSGGDCPRTLDLKGHPGWTMYQLAKAGPRGVTPLELLALRWSGYVHDLRKLGVPIETEMEDHGGPYSDRHARYRLCCDATVTVLGEGGQMTATPTQRRPQPRPTPVRRIMTKHALPEPVARAVALLVYAEGAQ